MGYSINTGENYATLTIYFSGGKSERHAYYSLIMWMPAKGMFAREYRVLRSGEEVARAGGGHESRSITVNNLPPNALISAQVTRKKKVNGTLVTYDGDDKPVQAYTKGKTFSASAEAISYNAARIRVNIPNAKSGDEYKIDVSVYTGSNYVIDKSYYLYGSGSFEITGLQQGTSYSFKVYLTQLYTFDFVRYYEYESGSLTTNTITTPTLASYLSTPVVQKAEAAGITQTARVYWNVVAKKANNVYKLYYQIGDNTPNLYAQYSDPPASGYTDVNVGISQTEDVTFYVVASNPQTPAAGTNVSNRVTIRMYYAFEWDYPKVAGQPVILTVAEWIRCKIFVGEKVPSFKSSEYYAKTIITGDIITDEEIQAVLDALSIDRSLGDGSAIAAAIFADIKNAINA